jgi:hypothetical protein
MSTASRPGRARVGVGGGPGEVGDEEWPADEPEELHGRGKDADGRRDRDERRVGVADRAREQHDERDHEHRGEREAPPEQHERGAAGAELREDVGRGLAQDVGVVEARGQQRKGGIERERDGDQQQSGDGRGAHGRGGSETGLMTTLPRAYPSSM